MNEEPAGSGPVRWPDQLVLRVGMVHPDHPRWALLASGIYSMKVAAPRVTHLSFGDVVFEPFTWSLVPPTSGPERRQLGPAITDLVADASDWVHFGPDRTSVDLRNLTRTFPALRHPAFHDRDDWVELHGSDDDDAGPVFLYGRLP